MEERLGILLGSGVISQFVYDKTFEIYNGYFKSRELEQEKLDLFFTHFSMALQRVEKDEPIGLLDSSVYDDVKASENFEACFKFWETVKEEVGVTMPESEERYIMLHLCNIFYGKEV